MIGAIFACSLDGIIGDGERMPWHLPEDLRHFREVTTGAPVIMGRKTWESLPERFRPLPGRDNLIISRRDPGVWSHGADVVDHVPVLDNSWVIGGGEIYSQTLPLVDVIEVTIVDVLLSDTLGDRAVHAPGIPDGFTMEGDTGWLTSRNGRLLDEEDGATLRYRFQRYRR